MSVDDPDAELSVETLVPPERHGGVIAEPAFDQRRRGRPYRYVYAKCITRLANVGSISSTNTSVGWIREQNYETFEKLSTVSI